MTSFLTEKCCRLVTKHEVSAGGYAVAPISSWSIVHSYFLVLYLIRSGLNDNSSNVTHNKSVEKRWYRITNIGSACFLFSLSSPHGPVLRVSPSVEYPWPWLRQEQPNSIPPLTFRPYTNSLSLFLFNPPFSFRPSSSPLFIPVLPFPSVRSPPWVCMWQSSHCRCGRQSGGITMEKLSNLVRNLVYSAVFWRLPFGSPVAT